MPASAKAVGPATRNAREEVKSAIWLTIGVSTLSPVPEQVDRSLREVAGALGGDQDQGATAIGYQTALRNSRNG